MPYLDLKKALFYLVVLVASSGFIQVTVPGGSVVNAQTPEENCTASGGSWVVQGTERGIQSFGCECPDRQLNGECVSQEELSCNVSSGGTYNRDANECECPTGQQIEGSICRFIANEVNSSSSCTLRSGFLGVPTWYRGLVDDSTCEIVVARDDFRSASASTNPALIIAANVAAILTRLAGIIVVIFIIVGGFKYVLSDGDPQRTAEARKTIVNALIGAVIVAVAATIVEIIYNTIT